MNYLNLVKIGFIVLVIAIIALAAAYVNRYYNIIPNCIPVKQVLFDSVKWKQGVLKIRGGMIESLKSSKALMGKTQKEITEVLGEPGEKKGASFTYFFYSYEKPCMAKAEMLIINFDEKTGKAKEAYTTD